MTSSQITAAGAYAQAERMAASIPVRPIDPTRRRFQVEDQAAAKKAAAETRPDAESADADGAAPQGAEGRAASGWGRGGFGLVGAVTSFLARLFSQGEDGAAPPAAASVQAGAQAYARAAGAPLAYDGGAEVLMPSLPRLSSGRALDLTV